MRAQSEERAVVSWEIFERAASRYESWYTTSAGQRADQAERALLETLLAAFPAAESVLEVGCGTGHFIAWLATKGLSVFGLDRSPAMLTECHHGFPQLPVLLSDAHHLPIKDGAFDLVVFVTTIEFLDDPERALREAVRVARQGVIVVALNRWSLGGLSRRWGAQARGTLLAQAHDLSVMSLRHLLHSAGKERVRHTHWTSTLFPNGVWWCRGPLPLGDVLGMAIVLHSSALPERAVRRG